MKAGKLFLICLLVMFAIQGSAWSQQQDKGIRLKEEKVNSNIFEIRVQGMFAEDHASKIDATMLLKRGVKVSSTDFTTHICTVEVEKTFREHYLADIIRFSGFEVAKSFNP